MENTGEILFEDNKPEWYVAIGQKPVGPMSASDVYQKVVQGQVAWTQLAWKPGQSGWQKLCDLPTFQAAMPKLPGASSDDDEGTGSRRARAVKAPAGKKAPPAPPVEEEAKSWFLYYSDSQYGPFSVEEIAHMLRIGKVPAKVHAWRDGMENWQTLDKIVEFKDALSALKKAPAPPAGPAAAAKKKADNRSAPRRPLVAKILMAGKAEVHAAMCRDISVGGMQVLMDQVPGRVGERLKMNVSSPGKKIESFVAEGVIVRLLEDGRGFSFRFEDLNDRARRAIETYVQSNP